jgi:predicted 2-oxoglutarate/Fe(II)-dependent dioxygenase YbiX
VFVDGVLTLPDFVTEADAAALMTAFEDAVVVLGLSGPLHVQQPRVQVPYRDIDSVRGSEIFRQIVAIRKLILTTMQRAFSTPALPDLTLLSEMRAGDRHPLHADAERQTPEGWEPNHAFWRTHAGILYLNTSGVDYEGGELHLPGVNRIIAPTKGMFVAFPSGRHHVHEVTEVKAGRRRTLSIWLTLDLSRVESFGER